MADLAGHELPTWKDVVERDYPPWESPRLVVDTARLSVADVAGSPTNVGKARDSDWHEDSDHRLLLAAKQPAPAWSWH